MKLAIVEDDINFGRILVEFLEGKEHEVTLFATGEEAKKSLKKETYDVVIIDQNLPDLRGEDLWRWLLKTSPETKVIVMTAYPDTKKAIKAIKEGVFDYLIKPISPDELSILLSRIEEFRELESLREYRKYQIGKYPVKEWFVGGSSSIAEIKEFVKKAASFPDTPVLISGETGTGKSLLARAIHMLSRRREHPFVTINCAAIPESLVESELFGYERGAFSGADKVRKGLMEIAGEGTVFLDEIGEIPPVIQVKLLHVLDTMKFRRLGGNREITLRARVIAATNEDLKEMIRVGKFRKDLFYRIAVLQFELPPLRDRKEDIIPLALHFLEELGVKNPVLTEEERRLLLSYSYPGNIRELKNIIERAFILGGGKSLNLPQVLPSYLNELERERPSGFKTLEEITREYTLRVLRATGGNKSKTAKILGISLSTLKRKLKKWGGSL